MGVGGHGREQCCMGRRGTRAIEERNVRLVRDAGALAELPIHLAALGLAKARTGDFVAAASLVAESEAWRRRPAAPTRPTPCSVLADVRMSHE